MTIKFIHPIAPTKADGDVGRIYADMKTDFMFAEPITLHAPSPKLLEAVWSVFRDVMIGAGITDRRVREIAAGAVSGANDCHFCAVTHEAMETASPEPSIAIDRGAFAAWAMQSMNEAILDAPGFDKAASDELRGVIVLFQYLNRMVSAFMEKASPFDPPPDDRPLSDAEQKFRQQMITMVSAQMAKTVEKTGPTDPDSVVDRIRAGLPTEPVTGGAVSDFTSLVRDNPAAITAEIATAAKTEAGGDAALLEAAAFAALEPAHATARL